MVFAVGFDGTLCFEAWIKVGSPNLGLFEFLLNRRRHGDKVILWTCRDQCVQHWRYANRG